MWTITNLPDIEENNYIGRISFNRYKFLTDNLEFINQRKNSSFMCVGYVSPRHAERNTYKNRDTCNMLSSLYNKYNEDFIHHVKGNYVIFHLEEESFKIYSDHFGIKKYFHWQQERSFIISDSLKEISNRINLLPSKENMCQYALTFHFTGGTTLYNNVSHNLPSEIISYSNHRIKKTSYWNPSKLLKSKKKQIGIDDLSDSLSEVIDDQLKFVDDQGISLSLTGGADTRNLLALFCKKEITPHLYTYGNPKSADCRKALSIAVGLELPHNIYDIHIDSAIFENYGRKIVRLSGGLASFHRAHRLIAIENEQEYANFMFLGTLGGEFIKGVSEDNYIVPSIVYDNWGKDISLSEFSYYLEQRYINASNIPKETIYESIRNESYMNGSVIERKLNALSYITAHLHDAQDVNLYNSVFKEVFTPFLDIDYLELLFSSNFTFDQKTKYKNRYLRRIQNPVYAANFLNITYPLLLKYTYSGDHKPSEVIFNKYIASVFKIIRKSIQPEYPPNFPLGGWMIDFIEKHLPLCKEYKEITEVFDLSTMISNFHSERHIFNESHWIKYTNPIFMRFILEEFIHT